MQIAVTALTCMACSYKNVVIRKFRSKMIKVRPKRGLQHVDLLHDNAQAQTCQKASIIVQILKSEKVFGLKHHSHSQTVRLLSSFHN
jgi:hypothetical protein